MGLEFERGNRLLRLSSGAGAGTILDLVSLRGVALLAGRVWRISLTHPNRVPQTAPKAQCLKPQAKSIWSSGF